MDARAAATKIMTLWADVTRNRLGSGSLQESEIPTINLYVITPNGRVKIDNVSVDIDGNILLKYPSITKQWQD